MQLLRRLKLCIYLLDSAARNYALKSRQILDDWLFDLTLMRWNNQLLVFTFLFFITWNLKLVLDIVTFLRTLLFLKLLRLSLWNSFRTFLGLINIWFWLIEFVLMPVDNLLAFLVNWFDKLNWLIWWMLAWVPYLLLIDVGSLVQIIGLW